MWLENLRRPCLQSLTKHNPEVRERKEGLKQSIGEGKRAKGRKEREESDKSGRGQQVGEPREVEVNEEPQEQKKMA